MRNRVAKKQGMNNSLFFALTGFFSIRVLTRIEGRRIGPACPGPESEAEFEAGSSKQPIGVVVSGGVLGHKDVATVKG